MRFWIPDGLDASGFCQQAVTKSSGKAQNMLWTLVMFSGMVVLAACSMKPQPPEDWNDRILVYKSLASDTGFAGYFLSFQEKTFLNFEQFLSTFDGPFQWREDPEGIWVLTLKKLDMDLTDNGPIEMHFKKEQSPSGNINVLLTKIVTQDYEIPWVLLDQVVMDAGEKYLNSVVKTG